MGRRVPPSSADAQITAQARLREIIVRAVQNAWDSLGSYDNADVRRFLSFVVPMIVAGQRQAVSLSDAYVARVLNRAPLGVDPAPVIAALRGGTPPQTVYRRPFVTVWSDLAAGKPYEDAVHAGGARAQASAAMDVQLAHRAGMQAVQDADPSIYGFARKADPDACPYCTLLDGAYVKRADALAMHARCGCALEVLTGPHPRAARLPDGRKVSELRPQDEPQAGVTVFDHGEYGATVGDPEHDHLTEAQALNR